MEHDEREPRHRRPAPSRAELRRILQQEIAEAQAEDEQEPEAAPDE